jgi:hypothetical protein
LVLQPLLQLAPKLGQVFLANGLRADVVSALEPGQRPHAGVAPAERCQPDDRFVSVAIRVLHHSGEDVARLDAGERFRFVVEGNEFHGA